MSFFLRVAVVAALALTMTGVPAAADENSSIEVDAAVLAGSSIAVSGATTYGTDAVGPITMSTDPAGDALVPGIGLDIGDVTLEVDLPAARLVFTMDLHDAAPDPMTGGGPATGWMIPIKSNREERWRWLGAGTAGTNSPPRTSAWGALCHNEAADGIQGGWFCDDDITTTLSASSIRWELPFSKMKPAITPGSVLESSSILCGAPCSFVWPSQWMSAGVLPTDSSSPVDSHKVPGEVMLAVAPAGTAPQSVYFAAEADLDPSDGSFAGSVQAPSAPGTYTVWARTCYGSRPTCLVDGTDIEIEETQSG